MSECIHLRRGAATDRLYCAYTRTLFSSEKLCEPCQVKELGEPDMSIPAVLVDCNINCRSLSSAAATLPCGTVIVALRCHQLQDINHCPCRKAIPH